MEMACSSEMLVTVYQTTWHHIPKDKTLFLRISAVHYNVNIDVWEEREQWEDWVGKFITYLPYIQEVTWLF
jgi:hypothetical protein